jgi:hypothetical protein
VPKIFSSCLSRTQLGFNTLNNLFAKIFQKREKNNQVTAQKSSITSTHYSLSLLLCFSLSSVREREREREKKIERERAFVGVFVCVCFWCVEKS